MSLGLSSRPTPALSVRGLCVLITGGTRGIGRWDREGIRASAAPAWSYVVGTVHQANGGNRNRAWWYRQVHIY